MPSPRTSAFRRNDILKARAGQSDEFIVAKIDELRRSEETLEKILRREATRILEGRLLTRLSECSYQVERDSSKVPTSRPYLNVGPGSFSHPNWMTADKTYDGLAWTKARRGVEQHPVDYVWDMYDRKSIAERDGFFKIIYCSHVIEHCFDDDVRFFLLEARRLLRPGGTLRLVCPDADLLIRAFANGDRAFFFHYLCVKSQRYYLGDVLAMSAQEQDAIVASFVLDWVSLVMNKRNPINFSAPEAIQFLRKHEDLTLAFSKASAFSCRDVNKTVGGHVNWFTADKLEKMMRDVGFSAVYRSGYLQSRCVELRDDRYFDRTDPEMSLYMEAVA